MKKRVFLVIIVVASILPGSLWAQAPDAPASREDILKLFEVMQIRDQLKDAMTQAAQQMRSMSRDAIKQRHPDLSESDLAQLDELSEKMINQMPVDAMLDDVVPVYQKHLSKGDVDDMVVFYSTPTGKKIMREMPAMMTEGMQATYPRLQKLMDDTMDQIEKKAREDELKKRQAKPAAPPKSS